MANYPPSTAIGIGTSANQTWNTVGTGSLPTLTNIGWSPSAIPYQDHLAAASSQSAKRMKRTLRPWEKGLVNLAKKPRRTDLHTVSEWYRGVSSADIIEELGRIRPISNSRPSAWIMPLLLTGPTSVSSPTMFKYYLAGLMYRTPFIAGRKKMGFRLSAAGLQLLEHYASKSKRFSEFFDLYVPNKARKEIYQDCFDFQMNALPESHKKMVIKHVEALAKIHVAELQRLRDVAKNIDWSKYYDKEKEKWWKQMKAFYQASGMSMSSGTITPPTLPYMKVSLLESVLQTKSLSIYQKGNDIMLRDNAGAEHVICQAN